VTEDTHGGRAEDRRRDRRDGRGRRIVAEALTAIVEHAGPGRSTADLDRVAAEVLGPPRRGLAVPQLPPAVGAESVPAVLCVSVNDAVVHGIPNGEVLARATWFPSTSARRCTGGAAMRHAASSWAPHARRMRRYSRRRTRHWRRASPRCGWQHACDVGHAIAAVARGAGYGLLANHGGHGIGHSMHEDPHVPNEGHPGKACGYGPAW